MRIICGTDFSTHAAGAATAAAHIAGRLNDTVMLTHVVEHVGAGEPDRASRKAAISKTRQRLAEEAKRLRNLGATVREELLFGSPYAELVRAGSRPSTRLIIVASLGWVAPSRFLIGSVAERTAENAPVPTLVMRDAEAIRAWVERKRPLRICLGYDFSISANSALDWIIWLQRIGPCEITVCHVDWLPNELKRLGVAGPISMVHNPLPIQEILERDLHDAVRARMPEGPVALTVQPGWGRTEHHLIEIAREKKADLLVVGTHQRKGLSRLWLGSVSRGVLHHAPMSIGIVPTIENARASTVAPERKRALVTTDFSLLGNAAIPHAYASVGSGGTVCILHVINLTDKSKNGKKSFAGSPAALESLIPDFAESKGVKTEILVVESKNVAREICQASATFGADLICMATHGRSGLGKALLGSVAQEVLARSDKPVLLVKGARK